MQLNFIEYHSFRQLLHATIACLCICVAQHKIIASVQLVQAPLDSTELVNIIYYKYQISVWTSTVLYAT